MLKYLFWSFIIIYQGCSSSEFESTKKSKNQLISSNKIKKNTEQKQKNKKQKSVNLEKINRCNENISELTKKDFTHFHHINQSLPDFPWKLEKRLNIKHRITARPFVFNKKIHILDHSGFLHVLSDKLKILKKIKVSTDKIWATGLIKHNTLIVGSDDDFLHYVNLQTYKQFRKIKLFECKKTKGANPEKVRCDIDSVPVKYKNDILVSSKGITLISDKGEIKWKFEVGDHVRSSPAVDSNGNIYFSTLAGKVFSFDSKGKKRWEYQADGQCDSSPVFLKNCSIAIGCDDNALHVLNIKNGKLKWKLLAEDDFRAGGASDIEGTLYYGSMDRFLYAINPNGRVKWRYKTYGRIMVPPLTDSSGNILIMPEEKRFYILDKTGKLLWYKNLPAISDTLPLLLPDKKVLIVTEKGDLLLFTSKKRSN